MIADGKLSDSTCVTILSVLLIITGIAEAYILWDAYRDYLFDGYQMSCYTLATTLYFVVGIALMVLRRSIILRKAAGLTAICIGLYYLSFGPDFTMPLLDYMESTVFAIVSIAMMVFGVLLYFGLTRDATTVSYMSFIIIAVDIITYIPETWQMSLFEFVFYLLIYNLPRTLLFLFLAFTLLRPGIKVPGMVAVLADGARRVMDTQYSAPDTYILRSDMLDLLGMLDRPASADGPRIQEEMVFHIRSSQGDRLLTVRRWRGDACLRATVSSDAGSLNGYDFSISCAVPIGGGCTDCSAVRFYGDDGFFRDITVFDPPVRYKDSLALN